MVPLSYYVILSAVVFITGLVGVLIRRNIIIILLSIELMLNAVNLGFIGFAYGMQSMVGVMFVFFVLIVAAAEAVIGLSIILAIFRNKGTLNIDELNLLRW